jgi:beta-glucosidase
MNTGTATIHKGIRIVRLACAIIASGCVMACATETPSNSAGKDIRPWLDAKRPPSERAEMALREMTQDEKLLLVSGYFATPASFQNNYQPPTGVRLYSAGYVPGIERLGIPPQWETDAGLGVATQPGPAPRERTALPSGLATAATWNLDLAERAGAMIGKEARLSGFNVMLAGSVNLSREPRNGRNFEYAGEDPLLAGLIVGAQIKGIQSNSIISTIKHFAFNDQETARNTISVRIADDAARMSDLLAFEIGIETGNPGAVMCAYNKVDGVYACESDYLLNQVLKGDWRYKGYVMSDWGAVHSTVEAANNGLDQQSAASFDRQPYFREPLRQAVAEGKVPQARLDDMARRILWAMFAHGVVDNPVSDEPERIDFDAHARITQAGAEEAAVLLKNNGVLPLSAQAGKIAVIGGHADVGVLSGGGSSQVHPRGGAALKTGRAAWPGPELYYPSSPLKAIQARAGANSVTYHSGEDIAAAADLARQSDVAIVFATQWAAESVDTPFVLRSDQDKLIEAVAAANPKTIVVLETGNPVAMPWVDDVEAVLEAWYPGTQGGEAIARVLFGEVNPSGKLPITFPKSESQLPEPKIVSGDEIVYSAGAASGYRWFDSQGHDPLFPFGHGLSYTRFDYSSLKARSDGENLTVTFNVRNAGSVAGKDIPQVYVSPKAGGWEAPKRLAGFAKVEVKPNGVREVIIRIDPRLLATFDSQTRTWRIAGGDYEVMLGASSRDIRHTTTVRLKARSLPASFNKQQP